MQNQTMNKKINDYNTLKAHMMDWKAAYDRKVAKFGEPASAFYMRLLLDATHRVNKEGVAYERIIPADEKRKYPIYICSYCNTQKEAGVMCECQMDKR